MKKLLILLLILPCFIQAQTLLPATNGLFRQGLGYKYYEGNWTAVPDFDTLTAKKIDTVANFRLDISKSPNFYGLVYNGYVNVPADGQYTFYTITDDGAKLYIDGLLVVENKYNSGEKSGTVGLAAGKHLLKLDFFQQDGDVALSVMYQGPGIIKKQIPSSELFSLNIFSFPLNVEVPALLLMSDTTRFPNDQLIYSRIFVVPGFIVYKDAKDPINPGMITFSYLDATKKELDKKYVVWLSKERDNAFIR